MEITKELSNLNNTEAGRIVAVTSESINKSYFVNENCIFQLFNLCFEGS